MDYKNELFLLILCIFYIFPSGTSLYLSSAKEKAIFQTEKKKKENPDSCCIQTYIYFRSFILLLFISLSFC